MESTPVPETDHGLANPPANEILSIQLRPDGLSFAYREGEEVKSATIHIPAEKVLTGFDFVFSAAEWPSKTFSSVRVCVPTDAAVLIPAALTRPENDTEFFASLGYPDDPGARIFAQSVPEGRVLLHGVCEMVFQPLFDKYGEKVTFYHPLAVNLAQPETNETVLSVDWAGGYACHTLRKENQLLFCDVFPGENPADVLFQVNRIVVSNKIGAFRTVCSGDQAGALRETLSAHYRNVELHPDGEDRNLLFPFR